MTATGIRNPVYHRGGRWKNNTFSLLTARQRQIAELLARGMRSQVIAAELGISYGTVKVYLSDAYTRLGVPETEDARLRLILYALSQRYE